MESKDTYNGIGFITKLLLEKSEQYKKLEKELELLRSSDCDDKNVIAEVRGLEVTNKFLKNRFNKITDELNALKSEQSDSNSSKKADDILEWYRSAPDCLKRVVKSEDGGVESS